MPITRSITRKQFRPEVSKTAPAPSPGITPAQTSRDEALSQEHDIVTPAQTSRDEALSQEHDIVEPLLTVQLAESVSQKTTVQLTESVPQKATVHLPTPVLPRPNSTASSRASTKAQKLAALARHARLNADRELRLAEHERKAAELELQAELAGIECATSEKSNSTQRWLIGCADSNMCDNNDLFPCSTLEFGDLPIAGTAQNVAVAYTSPNAPRGDRCLQFNDNMNTTHILDTHHTKFSPTNCNIDNRNKTINNVQTQDSFIKLAEVIADLGGKNKQVSIKLPLFDGSISGWLMFKKTYWRSEARFSPEENLARLDTALCGAAKEAVSALLMTAAHPAQIMSSLESRFGQPESIILHQLSSIRSLARLPLHESRKDLNIFACRLRNCVEVIRELHQPEYLASPELVNTIIGKLTPLLRYRWSDFASSNDAPNKYKLELLANFLDNESKQLAKHCTFFPEIFYGKTVTINNSQIVKPNIVTRQPAKVFHATLSTKPKSLTTCRYCKAGLHDIHECEKFISLPIDERWQWVTENKVCYRCLCKGSHKYLACKKHCEVARCKYSRKHNTLLHRPTVETAAHVDIDEHDEPQSEEIPTAIVSHSASAIPMSTQRSLLKVLPVTIIGPKASFDTYALLDDGSTASFIDKSVADLIGATGPKKHIQVECIGGLGKNIEVNFVNIQVKSCHSAETYDIAVRSIPNLTFAKQCIPPELIKSCDYLRDLADILCYENAKPMLLLGIDNWHLTFSKTIRHGKQSQPAASLTPLGWVLYGSTSTMPKPVDFVNHAIIESEEDSLGDSRTLDILIKDYYSLDSIGIKNRDFRSVEDQRALKLLEETTTRLPSGRFQTGLLWRDNIEQVPDSRPLALRRFKTLESKMIKDSDYAGKYKQNIHTMLDKGYAELCTATPSGISWYLPHFGVVHPQKKKLRIVCDAAAKCEGVSLNSLLLPGPDLLQSLLAILMRFREGRIALSADIREMFPQIKIRPEDRDAQRFLWRDDPTQPIQEYRMSSMIFGAVCSPFIALYLKNKIATEHQRSHPKAAAAIIRDTYMDDYLGSCDSEEEAALLSSDIVSILAATKFEMRSWVSNSTKALSMLSPDLCAVGATTINVGSDSRPSTRVLGVSWNIADDTLSFPHIDFDKIPAKLTKLVVLSNLMKVYDPLGLLTPAVIKGRVLFQKTWKLATSWDELLPKQFIENWRDWFTSLLKILNNCVPRCYVTLNDSIKSVQLHVFADASEQAYSCVAYWRFLCPNGNIQVSLISGKARVAPLKPTTIPRLELQAALIAARLSVFIVESHKRKPERIFFWSDSQTVLKWLRSDPSTFKSFVAHRVCEICEITNVSNWKYVPSSLNVADDATRFKDEFTINSRWFSGPSFLHQPSTEWPCEPTTVNAPTLEEYRTNKDLVGLTQSRDLPSPVIADYSRFSVWLRFIRATARAHQFASKFRHLSQDPKFPQCGFAVLDIAFISSAERHAFLHIQLDSFKDEYLAIDAARPVSKESRLKNLSLIMRDDRLLRLSGRTGASTAIDPRPVVLDGKHPLTRLLIGSYHVKFAHGNNELLVNELRQRFYIIGVRPSVKSVAKHCQLCRNRKAKPQVPPIGDLPEARMAHHVRPFTFVGIDYFGPLNVTSGRRLMKHWVALFTCLTVRAIHIEVVESLSTDSALLALRRFIARRGCPTCIYSDNGTCFVGASNMLHELYDFCTNRGITWKFIPPSAPFMGGCWERLIRSVKTALKITLKDRSPRVEVLYTLLAEVEAMVNSRPLTHVSVDEDTQQALTPFNFLIGTSSHDQSIRQFDEADLSRRADWRKAQRLAEHFWQRWTKEYLPLLVPRKSVTPHKELKSGDVVLVADGNLPRNCWPIGRVTELFPGKDNIVRVVNVVTKGGVLRRPVRKLVPLNC